MPAKELITQSECVFSALERQVVLAGVKGNCDPEALKIRCERIEIDGQTDLAFGFCISPPRRKAIQTIPGVTRGAARIQFDGFLELPFGFLPVPVVDSGSETQHRL